MSEIDKKEESQLPGSTETSPAVGLLARLSYIMEVEILTTEAIDIERIRALIKDAILDCSSVVEVNVSSPDVVKA